MSRKYGLHGKYLTIYEKPTSEKLLLRNNSGICSWSYLWLWGMILFVIHNLFPSAKQQYTNFLMECNPSPNCNSISFSGTPCIYRGEHGRGKQLNPILADQHNPRSLATKLVLVMVLDLRWFKVNPEIHVGVTMKRGFPFLSNCWQ